MHAPASARLLPLPVRTAADLQKALHAALDAWGPFSHGAYVPLLHLGPGVLGACPEP